MNIPPQYIQELAAEAFWAFVYKNSLRATGFPTKIEEIPEDLWSLEILIQMLIDNGELSQANYSRDLIEALYYAVAETIVDHNKREKNIIGILYVEDFKTCRPPNFAFKELIDKQIIDSDQESNYEFQLKGKYLNEGDLILRTPLPSGVLLKSKPAGSTPYIPNTLKALGFQKKLILSITDIIPLPANEYDYEYFATGVFYILTTQGPNLEWLKLIPNSIATLKGFQILYPDGKFNEGKIVPKKGNALPQKSINKKIFLDKILSFFN